MTILDLIDDPKLLGRFFKGESWRPWRIFLAVAFKLHHQLSNADLAIFRLATGRTTLPALVAEIFCCCGRRAGKSQIAAVIALFSAFINQYPNRSVGEIITIPVVAATRSQARTILRYIRGFINAVPHFRKLVVRDMGEMVELSNGVTIEILAGSSRSIRGYTFGCALCDEIGFWEIGENFSDPDDQILEAIRPSLATSDGLLVCLSSPYSRRGELWRNFQKHWGNDSSTTLYWKAASRLRSGAVGVEMNASLAQRVVDRAFEDDESAALADYHGEFRRDIETVVTHEMVDACVIRGRTALPPAEGILYHGFVDPSGGSADSFTAAISHADSSGRVVVDFLFEAIPPFSPDLVVQEICVMLRKYRIFSVTGDRYGGEWPRERFRVHGVNYEVSEMTVSQIYQSFLPLLNSARVELLDVRRMLLQLLGLERRVGGSGRDSISHPPGGHDDAINATAGSAVLAAVRAFISREPTFLCLTDERGQLIEEFHQAQPVTPDGKMTGPDGISPLGSEGPDRWWTPLK